jgi:tight adherence protein C
MLFEFLLKLSDTRFLVFLLTAIAAASTIVTFTLPLLTTGRLQERMRHVAIEREKIRARERERLANQSNKTHLRQQPKVYMKRIVEQFNLDKWLGMENSREHLMLAGFRGPHSETTFLFFRLVTPITLGIGTIIYAIFFLNSKPLVMQLGAVIGAIFLGIKGPELFLTNVKQKRQLNMRRAFPDSLDLLLICVESGMSIEHAFRKVSQEIGTQSVPLAEEFALATAELSYLPDRRAAYENLAARTGLEAVKNVCTALIQAERYGTPLGTALRVLSQESRDQRMTEAEKKAAGLPPKLTVPMIVFFLPVLFIVILMPALIKAFRWP